MLFTAFLLVFNKYVYQLRSFNLIKSQMQIYTIHYCIFGNIKLFIKYRNINMKNNKNNSKSIKTKTYKKVI